MLSTQLQLFVHYWLPTYNNIIILFSMYLTYFNHEESQHSNAGEM